MEERELIREVILNDFETANPPRPEHEKTCGKLPHTNWKIFQSTLFESNSNKLSTSKTVWENPNGTSVDKSLLEGETINQPKRKTGSA